MARVATAIIGTGFMGRVHAEQIRRLGFVDIAGVAGINAAEAAAFVLIIILHIPLPIMRHPCRSRVA